ncbi:MAG TPA: hypothetical protein VFK84_13085 [Burkholderiales bacterium]|nr:hypothetical protein [Burkholderiales bacterium]
MKNRDLNRNPYLNPAELYALERDARRARSAELGRLLQAGLTWVKRWVASGNTTKGLRHA